ncbi:MAG: hypothetical protein FJ291_20050 [Planctomycetes bacterium]|nr:hypothetical protein [Planctomycetota bacterium]
MPLNELTRKLRGLRGRLRGLIVLAGASRFALAVVAALAAAFVLDWTAKLETPGRFVLLFAAIGAWAYALIRFLIIPLRVRLGDDELALLVEERHPELRDRLISTVQFARARSVEPLSQAMVDRLAHDARDMAAPLDFRDVASARQPAYWALAAAFALAAASAYTILFPANAAIFAYRFFDPLSSVEWPQRTQLALLAYDKDGHSLPIEENVVHVPKGEDLNVLVRAARSSGALWRPPRRVTAHYRYEGGSSGSRSVPMGDEASYPTCFATVAEPFSFYVTGDDATTPTVRVDVRNRPRVEDLRLTIRAPAYTGEPERVQADGRGAIAALAGSVVRIELKSSKPIAQAPGSAAIAIEGQPPIPLSFAETAPGTPPNTRLEGSFTLRANQKEYAITLVDTDGLNNSPPATYRLDVRPDREPAVKLPKPGASKKVTPRAVVPIRLEAEDEYGVTRSRFVYRRGDEKAKPTSHPFPDEKAPARKVERAHEWDLTALALKEHEQLRVHGEAEDAYAETVEGKAVGPNVGRSPTYVLTVVSAAEMAAALQRQQQEIKERIKKLIGRQEAEKGTVEQLRSAEKLDRRNAAVAEREQMKIAAAAEAIAAELEGVVADMKHNKVGTPVDQRRAEELGQAVNQAAKKDMPDAARQIARAGQANERPEQLLHLAAAATRQQQVVDDLRAALAKFDQWSDVDELVRDASELLLTQKKLNESTADMARKLLGKPEEQLTPAEKGAARSLARSQQGARDTMAALETKMAEVAAKIRDKDPAASKTVEQALSQASSDQIRKKMDDAGTRIEQARPASALPSQAEATQALERLVETLTRARSPHLAKELRRLQQEIREKMEALDKLLKDEQRQLSETEVANLRRQLQRLREQQEAAQGAASKADSQADLQKQAAPQGELAKQAEELGRQLERLTERSPEHKDPLGKAQEAVKNAFEQMSQASKSLEKASKDDATKAQAEAGRQLKKAEEQLAGLQDKLAEGKRQLERLGERSSQQDKTAKATSEASQGIQKMSEEAQKTLPTTAKSVEQASQNANDAAKAMQEASKQLEEASKQPDAGPSQQESAQKQQQESADQLKKARDELAKAHDQLDLQRRAQELFELQKVLTEMLPRQVTIREGTAKLDAASEGGQKPLGHAQSLALRELADAQGKLHEEAGQVAERLEREQVPIFHYVMKDAARLMGEVHKRLGDKQVDWLTQEAQREIERDIMQLLDAMKSETERLAQQQQQPPPPGGGPQGGKPQPLVPPAQQLKQLKTLQLQVNTETKSVEIERATGGARERLLKHRAARLAAKQAELGKLSRDFGDIMEKAKEGESLAPP